jgi:hypothetical protein
MKTAWIALALIVSCGALAWSQPPAPAPTKQSDPHQQQATNENQPAADGQRGTENAPFIVKIVDGNKPDKGASNTENKGSREALILGMTADYAAAVFTGLLVAIGAVTALVFGWQSWLLRQQVTLFSDQTKLARQEFAVTHRPRVIVRNFTMMNPEMADGDEPRFIFLAYNIGDSPAKIIEVRSGTLAIGTSEKLRNDWTFPFFQKFDCTLVSGQSEVFPGNGGEALGQGERHYLYGGYKYLLCMGTVTYLDGDNNRRITGFCRRWNLKENEWEKLVESEYEYCY